MYGQIRCPAGPRWAGAKQEGLKYWPDFRPFRGSQVRIAAYLLNTRLCPGTAVGVMDVGTKTRIQNSQDTGHSGSGWCSVGSERRSDVWVIPESTHPFTTPPRNRCP